MWTFNEAPLKLVALVLGVVVTGTTASYKTATFVDGRYVHAPDPEMAEVQSDLYLIEQRLEQKILNDRYSSLQQRLWKIEDRYAGPSMTDAPETVMEERRQILDQLRELEKELSRVSEDFKKAGHSNDYYDKRDYRGKY